MSLYQSRTQKKHPEVHSLDDLLTAVANSEEQFQQYPTDHQKVKAIAYSIFIADQWMMQDIALAIHEEKLYVIGGRHRIAAITHLLGEIITNDFRQPLYSDEDRENVFQTALQQTVRCEVVYVQTLGDLLTLIKANNESRTMRRAEQAHLDLQLLGGDAKSIESVGKVVFNNELSAKQAIVLAAQDFVRRVESRLQPQTKQVIGERVARYVLFGDHTGRLNKSTLITLNDVEEFKEKMNKAWHLLEEIIAGEGVVAKHSKELADRVIEKMGVIKPLAEPKKRGRPAKMVATLDDN